MAAGDSKLFRDFVLKQMQGDYSDTDVYKLVFVTNQYSTINADATSPVIGSVTAASGGNVAASYTLASFAVTRATTTITVDAADIGTISKHASNPATIKSAIIYNDTSATDDLVQAFDLTSDGSTAIDLVNNDLAFTFGAAGLMTATVS